MSRADEIAIKVTYVNKSFKLPHEKQTSIKGLFINVFNRKRTYEKQQVLKDVSFDIKKGEFFGIVGRNGSGKSTLLKLLAGIYSPDSGHIQVNGKLTPFIELGVGFNPELTGRENVFLNGALLGFSRKEMLAMYDEIVEFAELEKFMDQKLKNYSSGMQVRLAFSIAIRAKSDILVLDEVLAVGDEAFQRKCIDIFEQYKASDQTIVLVTHDMETVRRFCSRAILINDGQIMKSGEPNLIAASYSRLNREIETASTSPSDSVIQVDLCDKNGKKAKKFTVNDELLVNLTWPDSLVGVKNVGVALIKNSGEYVYGANTIGNNKLLKNNKMQYSLKLSLGPGKYYIMAGLFGDDKYKVVEFLDRGPEIIIDEKVNDKEHGLARLDHKWNYYD